MSGHRVGEESAATSGVPPTLAGLASGFWPDIETIARNRVEGATFRPKADRAIMNKLRAKWRDAVERSKGWYRETV